MTAGVDVEIKHIDGEPVAWITIDEERRLNVLNSPRIAALKAAFDRLSGDDSLRAVVVTGAGSRAFVGGADLRELGSLDEESARVFITGLHEACAAARKCPVPVIARVNGFCLGAGLELAASCDMRVSVDNAIFGMPEVRMGLPSVIEAALLPGLIGWGKTREMLLTGATYDAQATLDMGFVERVTTVEGLDGVVSEWLEGICTSAPMAVKSQKTLMATWERVSLEDGILAGIDSLSEAYGTGEPQERIAAFFAAKTEKKAS